MAEQDTVTISKDKLKEVVGAIEMIRAIEILEYYNKNHLSGNNESRSQIKINLATEVLQHVYSIRQERGRRYVQSK